MFHVNQKVIYRPRNGAPFIFAIVKTITATRVTIEFEAHGVPVKRAVKPDTLQPLKGLAPHLPTGPGP